MENAGDFLLGQDDRQARSGARASDLAHPWQIDTQHLGVEKDQGRERLLVRGRRDTALVGQPGQKRFDLGTAEIAWVLQSMKPYECPAPLHVGLLGSPAVVQESDSFAYLVRQLGRAQGRQGRCRRWH